MRRHLIACTIRTKDVGATIAAEVRLGEALVGRYLCGTSDHDHALEVMETELASQLRALLLGEPLTAPLLDVCPFERWDSA